MGRESESRRREKRHETLKDDDQISNLSTETEDYSSSSSSEDDYDRRSTHKKKDHRKRSTNSSKRRYSESESESSESESERRRRKRRERKRREEKRLKKDKGKKKRKRDDDDGDDDRRRKGKKKKKEKREKKGKIGAVTNSWGKYGTIHEADMCTPNALPSLFYSSNALGANLELWQPSWQPVGGKTIVMCGGFFFFVEMNKRPEFTAWLAEVKQVNLESIPNRDEKIMFKEYMEDYNTATFPSKKYYNIDAYNQRKREKQMKKGLKKPIKSERIEFNDEEQRRQELQQAREKEKEKEVVERKNAMKSGLAQAMQEQVRMKEEMLYLFKIGDNEAAIAIQKKLEPDAI